MQTWKRRASWVPAAIVILAIASGGKAPAGQSRNDTTHPAVPVADPSWPEVNLNVVVLDRKDAPQSIDEHQCQLFEDGAERRLEFRGSPDSPISVALIIDSSGSMYKRRDLVIAAVHAMVKALPEGSEVAAVLFADQSYLDLPFTPVSKVDFSFLDRLNPRGGTAFYDAVVATEKYFGAHAGYVRRALVLVSDGVDNSSHSRLEDAIRSLQWPGAPAIYSLYGYDKWASYAEIEHGHRTMEALAKAGGGAAFTPRDKDFVTTSVALAAVIRSQYVLRFTAADPARNGKAHKLEVRLPIRDTQILALPLYYAPTR